MALCTDSELRDGDVVGDPTEGALVVLAEKGGIDIAALRREQPRVAEVPFDSDYKFMATFHRWTDERRAATSCAASSRAPRTCWPRRADRYLGGDARSCRSTTPPGSATTRANADARRAGHAGARGRGAGLPRRRASTAAGRPEGPARPGRAASRWSASSTRRVPRRGRRSPQCRDAGIRVRMITGDHAVTAGAIAAELGIPGQAVTGADLDRIDDDDLGRRLDGIGVVARVSPEHKIRIVRALQARGDVVAMTGDGVNDAPALRKADIGVAMGVTGTEVTKEAATMILTDDNFATIVGAVREGRGIYDNIVKFIRFQVSTALGFVLTFLVASMTGIAGGAPFTALQILFVNLVMDGPPAMSLGRRPGQPRRDAPATASRRGAHPDPAAAAPDPARQHRHGGRHARRARVGTRTRTSARGRPPSPATMAFVTFVFFQVVQPAQRAPRPPAASSAGRPSRTPRRSSPPPP